MTINLDLLCQQNNFAPPNKIWNDVPDCKIYILLFLIHESQISMFGIINKY